MIEKKNYLYLYIFLHGKFEDYYISIITRTKIYASSIDMKHIQTHSESTVSNFKVCKGEKYLDR